jgi:hypothetical protein
MGKTLAELISDAASDDNLELALADGTKFKLSDVRGFRNGVETERQAATSARKEAEKTALEAKQIFDALKSAQDAMNANTPKDDDKKSKGSDWKKNPLYDEIVPVFDALEAKANQAFELAGKLGKSLELSQATYAAERLRREWAESEKSRPKEAKFEEVVQQVLARKDVDDLGLPTLSKWMKEATEPTRMEAFAAEKVAAAKKEWEKANHAANIPKPGGKFQTRKSGEGPIKKLDELTSDVIANDPDIPSLDGLVQ